MRPFFLTLLISLLWCKVAFADPWKEAMIAQALYKYDALEKHNKQQITEGRFDLTQYVIELSDDWVEEKEGIVILQDQYSTLSTTLRYFNNNRKDDLRFYVFIANNYKAQLDELIIPGNLPSKIERLDDIVQTPSIQEDFVRFKNEIGSIPAAINEALDNKNYKNRIVYFYGRIHLYKADKKPHIYKYDNLSIVGPKLDDANTEIRSRAKSGITNQSTGQKIERLVTNVINATQILVDGDESVTPDINCNANLDEIAETTLNLKDQYYDDIVLTASSLIDAPSSGQQLNSRYLIVNAPDDFPMDDDFFSTVLPDRLNLLPANSQYKLYVAFIDINFGLKKTDWEKLAADVYEKSTVARQSNSIVMVVPYLKASCTELNWLGLTTTTGTGILMPAVHSANSALNASMNSALQLNNLSWKTAFGQAFSHIPKKHFLYKYAVSYDFLTKRYATVIEDGPGYDEIFECQIYVDSRLNSYVNAQREIAQQWQSKVPSESVLLDNRSRLEAIPGLPATFDPLEHGLKEMSLAQTEGSGATLSNPVADQFVRWFVGGKMSEGNASFYAAVSNWMNDATHSPEDGHFILGKNPVVVENYLASVDALGVALNFAGLDWIADGAGFLIASYYRDETNKIIYATSLAIPVGAILIKTAANRLKALRRTLNGEWELVEEAFIMTYMLSEKLQQFPNISRKIDAFNDQTKRQQFLNDFNFATEDVLVKLEEGDGTLVDAWEKMIDLGCEDELRKNLGAVNALSQKIRGVNVSLPNSYLTQQYIDDHLAEFDLEVSTLTFENSINTYGQIGRNDGLFVLTKKEMDELLTKTGGDIGLIETELGIPSGIWRARLADPLKPDKLVRIDIKNPRELNLRMATGNEGGANELWIPGGKTPKGLMEAVIDPVSIKQTNLFTMISVSE